MEGDLERAPSPGDPSRLRISDADRHRVAELLREAAGEGRLDLAELDERLEAAYAAKTYADLVPITADLPDAGGDAAPSRSRTGGPVPAPRFESTRAVLGGSTRRGEWEVGARHRVLALMGGVELDLRLARFTEPETVIHVRAFWGGVEVLVGEDVRVVVEGTGVLGSFHHASDRVEPQLGPDSPTVRVRGVAVMAGVTVQRRARPDRRPDRALPEG